MLKDYDLIRKNSGKVLCQLLTAAVVEHTKSLVLRQKLWNKKTMVSNLSPVLTAHDHKFAFPMKDFGIKRYTIRKQVEENKI